MATTTDQLWSWVSRTVQVLTLTGILFIAQTIVDLDRRLVAIETYLQFSDGDHDAVVRLEGRVKALEDTVDKLKKD